MPLRFETWWISAPSDGPAIFEKSRLLIFRSVPFL
jgi:hypothetical protein